jgi:type IV secretory pathway VirJ component
MKLFIFLLGFLIPTGVLAADIQESTLSAGGFGTVHIYRQSLHPRHVVLFVSGDGGWNLGVVDMARELARLDALVAGVDIIAYLKQLGKSGGPCLYPAADFEALSKFVQKSLGYPSYVQPILVGYSSGATLVYALICQAPPNTFKAAISLGFCPDLPLKTPPCKGSGLTWKKDPKKKIYIFEPDSHLETPWVALQGNIDEVCNEQITNDFVAKVPGAKIVMLNKVGHGFSVPKNWLPQFKQAFSGLTADSVTPPTNGLDDLPLVEVPAKAPIRPDMAVLITGDGGWAGLDRDLSGHLADHGMGVVGLNSLKYFWTSRTPDSAAQDLSRILTYYLQKWNKKQIALIGYSLGADVLPFMAARLPAELRVKISTITLLAPGQETAFEFHISDWFGNGKTKRYPVLPEVNKLVRMPILCFYGNQENDSLCKETLPPNVIKIHLEGGHHLGGNYDIIAQKILGTGQCP